MSEREDLELTIERMSGEDRDHFKKLISVLAKCYLDGGPCAVVTISHSTGMDETLTINCDDMEALEIVQSTMEYLAFVNTKDAPPREMMN